MPLRDDLLKPIPGASPGGADLRYEEVTDKLKEARREDDQSLPADDVWAKAPKLADWPQVVKLAGDALATKSKDLQIAAWLTEALLRQEGFAGLKSGLELMNAMLEQFWDHVYPLPDGKDLDQRAAPLNWVGTALESSVRTSPLTKSGYGLLKYNEARAVGLEADAKDEKAQAARQAAIADGHLTGEEFDKAFEGTPKAWYKQLVADLHGAASAVKTLDNTGAAKFGNSAPSYSRLVSSLDEVKRAAQQLLEKKLETDPDLVEAAATDDSGEAIVASGESFTAEPANADDAARRIVGAAHYLRRAQPVNPAPYLVLRALRWGELRARPELDPKLLAAPSTQVRTSLRTLVLDAKWPELLEAGENVMGTPQGRGWLDVQRYELTACENLGPEYERVASAIRSMLVLLLRDFPQLPDASLMDDLPTANGETRAWLRSAGIIGAAEEAAAAAASAPAAGGGLAQSIARGGVGDRALEEVRAGRPQKGIEMLMREAAQEKSPRARFLRRSEAASIMVDTGLEPVALSILTELVDQVETHKLDEWESGDVVARPMGLLYRCLQKLGGDEQKKSDLYRQICRLDPLQAMSIPAASQGTDGAAGA